jgi:hypothetical protein
MSDIVDRLRAMAGPIVPNVCTEAADEIERLQAERDEARRIACAYVSGTYRKDRVTLDRAATLAEAKRRGWDCFEEDGK